ncbi:hypothetical protein GOP47_0022250 [Adiantum capillus-veneris]|uniref:Uncharacterized protein n=1 Tax=Adiantum capillus-veneris TaxID=13818 RepID=A0A9D4U916_ADICA|nr:hypothetical protein GOP47_0022250 [Adiantum capillus-veneris]
MLSVAEMQAWWLLERPLPVMGTMGPALFGMLYVIFSIGFGRDWSPLLWLVILFGLNPGVRLLSLMVLVDASGCHGPVWAWFLVCKFFAFIYFFSYLQNPQYVGEYINKTKKLHSSLCSTRAIELSRHNCHHPRIHHMQTIHRLNMVPPLT